MNIKNNIIYPIDNRFLESSEAWSLKDSLIFLGGPIRHAPEWQLEAIKLLRKSTETRIACPRRPHFGTKEECESVGALWQLYDNFQRTDWELNHLDYARQNGVVMFFLAKPISHDCNYPYAQTTRVEMGFMLGKNASCGIGNVVIGIEEGFPGSEYIEYLVSSDRVNLGKGGLFWGLEEACKATIDIVEGR